MVQVSDVQTLERHEDIAADTLDPRLAEQVEALVEGKDYSPGARYELIEVRDPTGHWYVTSPIPGVRYYTF